MAGAVTASLRLYLATLPPALRPKIVVCEPVRAAGVLHYMGQPDQNIETGTYDGNLITKAAGLSCGTPSYVGFEILRRQADAFMTVPEGLIDFAARWMYGDSYGLHSRLFAGESGAFGLAALLAVRRAPGLDALREYLGLADPQDDQLEIPESRVLVINTEGPTNPIFADRIRSGALPRLDEAFAAAFDDLRVLPDDSVRESPVTLVERELRGLQS